MLHKIKLKNSEETVLIDSEVYHFLVTDARMQELNLIKNLRRHSSGCAVFQKNYPQPNGTYKTETIYLHKLIAEKFKLDEKTERKKLVGTVNGNKLDCRLENIEWRTRSTSSRKRKTSSQTGYTGVYRENNRYRAIISIDRQSMHIGMFATAEEAAMAYNKKSRELFGAHGKLNIISMTSVY